MFKGLDEPVSCAIVMRHGHDGRKGYTIVNLLIGPLSLLARLLVVRSLVLDLAGSSGHRVDNNERLRGMH